MRSKSVSPLGTLLTIVAVLAVPLLAIFGIPQFVPVVASSSSGRAECPVDESWRPPLPSVAPAAEVPLSGRDIFAPITRESIPPARSTVAQPRSFTPAVASAWPQTRSPGPTRPSASTSAAVLSVGWTKDDVPTPTAAARTAAPPERCDPFTWKTAVARLNELGIRQFQLQPGHQPGTFHFCCYLAEAGDSRVSVRFESETEEPLEAVRQVLDQVTKWYQTR